MVALKSLLLYLGLSLTPAYVVAGRGKPDGFSPSAPSYDDYCFLTIYNAISSYTFQLPGTGSATTSASGSSASSGSGSSRGGSSSGHGGHKRAELQKRRKGGGSSSNACTLNLEVASLYASAKAYCNDKQFAAAIPYWQSLCTSGGYTLMDLTEIAVNVTQAYIDALPVLNPDSNSTSTAIEKAVILDKAYYEVSYHTSYAHDYAFEQDALFSWGFLGFWGGIMVLGMLHKIATVVLAFFADRRLSSRRDAEGAGAMAAPSAPAAAGPLAKTWHLIRTWFIIPAGFAPFSEYHQRYVYWHTIPRRLDLLIVSAFWITAIVLSFVRYDSFSGNLSTVANQNWQLSADRTGILSYACLPFLWLFGGRNNIFLWATDFSFRSFNIFHRHVAWVATFEAIVHSINYTVLYTVYSSSYASSYESNYFYMGVVATITMSLMVVLAHSWLRQKFYESFLIIHIVLAIVTIYALLCHTNFENETWQGYLYPVVAIWGFDRAVRIVRVLYCNLHVKFSKGFIHNETTVRYFADADLLRIEMSPGVRAPFKPGPGQYYYLYQPMALLGWENHPFTLGAYTTKDMPAGHNGVASMTSITSIAGSYESSLVFYVRPYDGWTQRLRKQCQKAADGIVHPKLLIEGPYGEKADLHHFDTLLLFVGGTGIASAVPYILDHIQRAENGTTRTTNIQLIWSGRQKAMFEHIADTELRDALQRNDFHANFYITGRAPVTSTAVNVLGEKMDDRETPSLPQVKAIPGASSNSSDSASASSIQAPAYIFINGRPDVKQLVAATVEQSKASSSKVAVLVCGPAQMGDDSRAAVFTALRSGFHGIEYFEETFGW
ncbi:hypothetical protein SBRCBS47491_004643 [Sporothrix bragantina]|uniref:FAD-binding FR-type domain-containing protein n=1 Tax=Sporothrix bragantina TaxID=671064 RepID=A0ABP0BQR8_9PEZI